MKNILDLNLNELKAWMKEKNEKEFRAKQVFTWIYSGVSSFEDMNNVPKNTIEKIKSEFYIGVPKIIKTLISENSETRKHLFLLEDNKL